MFELAKFFWYVFLAFTIISLLMCVEAYFHYRNKRGIDDDKNFNGHYRYFGQSIRNSKQEIIGYELLLREYDQQKKQWHLPQSVADYPLSRMVQDLKNVEPHFGPSVSTLAINMTVNQLLDFRADNFFNWLLSIVNQQVLVELNANDLLTCSWLDRRLMRRRLCRIDHRKIKVALEGVDSSSRMYKLLRPYLPMTDYIKFDAHSFNKSAHHWIDVTLNQWKKQLMLFHVDPVLGRMEDEDQMKLADQLGIKFRQGYAYDRPKLI